MAAAKAAAGLAGRSPRFELPALAGAVGAAGFTLAELLIVVFMMTIVMSGLAIMQDAMLRDKGKLLRNAMVHNQADFARRRMVQVLSNATEIMSPDVGTWSNEIIGWQQLDTFMFSAPCTTATCAPNPNFLSNWKALQGTPTWFRLCYNPTSKQLYYYRTAMTATALAAMPQPGTCGSTAFQAVPVADWLAGTGTVHVELLNDPTLLDPDPNWTAAFHRVRRNVIELGFSVQTGDTQTNKIHAEVLTSVNILAPAL